MTADRNTGVDPHHHDVVDYGDGHVVSTEEPWNHGPSAEGFLPESGSKAPEAEVPLWRSALWRITDQTALVNAQARLEKWAQGEVNDEQTARDLLADYWAEQHRLSEDHGSRVAIQDLASYFAFEHLDADLANQIWLEGLPR